MVTVKEPNTELADFWDARPNLTRIRDFAHSRMAPAWGVFGCALAKAVANVPPSVVLPAIVGSEASLNLFVGIVGKSGQGKGVSDAVSDELVDYVDTVNVGSGEGIPHMFAVREAGELKRTRFNALISVAEIDTLAGINDRKGSTLLPELRKAWMGETLGFHYADPKKRLQLDRHSYRMCLIAGIQPERASVLLNDVDGGTPQRFVWLPGTDPSIPPEPHRVPKGLLKLAPMPWGNVNMLDDMEAGMSYAEVMKAREYEFEVCETAVKEIQKHRHARATGLVEDDGDGHKLLAQEKIAAGISIISSDEPGEITDEDWQLAGEVMKLSRTMRDRLTDDALQRQQDANRTKGYQEAERSLIVQTKTHEHHVNRVAETMKRKLEKNPKISDRDLRNSVSSRDREYKEEALAIVRGRK